MSAWDRYAICHRDRPWIVLFASTSLEEIAAALAAQPDRGQLEVVCNDGLGPTRNLIPREQEALDDLLAQLLDGA